MYGIIYPGKLVDKRTTRIAQLCIKVTLIILLFAFEGFTGEKGTEMTTPSLLIDNKLVVTTAEQDFPGFLKAAWSQKKDYGFLPDDQQEMVSLAKPIFVYSMDKDTIKSMPPGKIVSDILVPAGEWIFPVQVNGQYRTLFGLRIVKNKWKGVYLGNPYLAASLQNIRQVWNNKGIDQFQLISSVNPRSFFFLIPKHGTPNLTPLTYLKIGDDLFFSPPKDWSKLTPAHTIFDALERFWEDHDIETSVAPGGFE